MYKISKICMYQEQESLKRQEVRYVLHSTIMDVNRYDAYDISLFYLYIRSIAHRQKEKGINGCVHAWGINAPSNAVLCS